MPKYKLLVITEVEIEADSPDAASKAFWATPPVLSETAAFPIEILQIRSDGFCSRAGNATFDRWMMTEWTAT